MESMEPPILDAGDSSGSDVEDPTAADRAAIPVGRRRNLHFIGTCVGHDVSWRGSQVTRVVTLQAGGVGGADREAWGRWWADCAAELGADVFVLAETRIGTARGHAQAVAGMEKGGFVGISHNVDPMTPTSSQAPSPMSSGIIIAVRKDYVGNWQQVARDSDGRALAGTLLKDDGAAIRVVGVYGPTGATSASFDHDARALSQEQRLVEFVSSQKAQALLTDTSLLVAGDTNSYTSPDLDCWEGPDTARPACLALRLQEMSLHDCFRELHPQLKAFTFFTRQGTASRLDQIWYLGGIGGTSQVLNAAVVWKWQRRTDHDPVVVDLSHSLPTTAAPPATTDEVNWRRVVQASLNTAEADELRAQIRAALDPAQNSLEEAMTRVRQQKAELFNTPSPMATVFEPGGVPDRRDLNLREAIERATSIFHSSVAASLPRHSANQDFALFRVKASWEECIHQLRSMKTLLLHVSDNDQAITQISDQHVVVQKLWERSARYSRKILSGTEQSEDRSSIEDWDGFRLDPQAWARSLIGVSEQAIQLWEPTTPADGTDPPGTFLLSLEWSSPPVTRRARLECASLVNSWISAARNYQARCQ